MFWIDTDMIVTRAIRTLLEEFPRDSLILAEEWDQHEPVLVSHFWGLLESPDRCRSTPVSSAWLRRTGRSWNVGSA